VSVKRLIKQCGAAALSATGRLRAHRVSIRRNCPKYGDAVVLMYHRVVADWERDMVGLQPGMAVTVESFERQLAILKETRTVVPLGEIVDAVASERALPSGAVAITFDDGWRDNYVNALPLLKKYELPACLFVTTDYIETDRLFWFHALGLLIDGGGADALARLRDLAIRMGGYIIQPGRFYSLDSAIEAVKVLPPDSLDMLASQLADELGVTASSLTRGGAMLSWKEVRQLRESGIEIGSHGCSHRIMTELTESELTNELERSRELIEGKTGAAPTLFAYPNGDCSKAVAAAAEAAGYRGAVSTTGCESHPERPHPFMVRRINVHEGTTSGWTGSFSTSLWSLALSGYPDGGCRI